VFRLIIGLKNTIQTVVWKNCIPNVILFTEYCKFFNSIIVDELGKHIILLKKIIKTVEIRGLAGRVGNYLVATNQRFRLKN